MLQVVCISALMAGCFWILRPFLLPMIWATAIVVATWPLMLRVEENCGGRRAAAVVVMTIALLLILVVPLALALSTIIQNTEQIIGWAKSLSDFSMPGPPDWLGRLPLVGPTLAGQWEQMIGVGPAALSSRLAPYAGTIVALFAAQVGNVGLLAAQFLLTVVLSAVLYAGGEKGATFVLRFARRLAGASAEGAVQLAAQAVRAVALGIVVTALVQAILGGIGLALSGVPFAAVLTAVMFMLGVAQVGPALVLLPAVVWLYWRGDTVWGTVLLVWTVVVLSFDNFLRPLLIKRGANLPLLLVFTGVIGGLLAFGILGLFIGPVLLAVGFTLLTAWMSERELEGERASPDERAS
jgi:predicted PurR-regulated permease PerM